MKYVLFSLSEAIILPETKRDGTEKRPQTPMKMKFRNDIMNLISFLKFDWQIPNHMLYCINKGGTVNDFCLVDTYVWSI